MSALIVLGLLLLAVGCLAAALFYLYRWLVRRRLFPQLPRLWSGDRRRFLVSSLGSWLKSFLLCVEAYIFATAESDLPLVLGLSSSNICAHVKEGMGYSFLSKASVVCTSIPEDLILPY